jgi:hypothetical protein
METTTGMIKRREQGQVGVFHLRLTASSCGQVESQKRSVACGRRQSAGAALGAFLTLGRKVPGRKVHCTARRKF